MKYDSNPKSSSPKSFNPKTLGLGLNPDEEFVLIGFLEQDIFEMSFGYRKNDLYEEMIKKQSDFLCDCYRKLPLESRLRINEIEVRWAIRQMDFIEIENGGPADYDRPPFLPGFYW